MNDFVEALSQGFVPAGEEAQAILYEPNQAEEARLNGCASGNFGAIRCSRFRP